MMTRDWDAYWRERVYLNASMSTCIRRKVGAVAVRDRRSFADAFNGNIPGAQHCDEGGCPRCNDDDIKSGEALELCLCVHAEANIVTFCARHGIPLGGAMLYCTTRPCADCVKLLVSAGVKEVVFSEPYPWPRGFADAIGVSIHVRRFRD